MLYVQSIIGLLAFMGIAFWLSENRSGILWKNVLVSLVLQVVLGIMFFKIPLFKTIFVFLNQLAAILDQASLAGTSFVFGFLGGGASPYDITNPNATFVFATRGMPIIIVVSALSSLLYYLRVLPFVVQGISKFFQKVLNLSGVLAVGMAANIFLGMVESPLLIKPYLERLTRSELFVLMTGGLATVSGTVLMLYASILGSIVPDSLGHIILASIMSVPATVLLARMIIPETNYFSSDSVTLPRKGHGIISAIADGTTDGLAIFLQVCAMLISFLALVAMVNIVLSYLPEVGGQAISLQNILGYLLKPFAWLLSIPWSESQAAGSLLGTKVILNELIAYLDMAALKDGVLSDRSRLILTYAMCGFANFGSLGILLGGLVKMVPSRKDEIASLAWKSLLAGILATMMTGSIVGLLI
ncbi:MAG: nucleoside:proton symporter [Desulfotalea sp.]